MKKGVSNRLLCGALSVLILFGGIPEDFLDGLGASVSYDVDGGKIYFDTETGTVTGSDRDVTDVVIPETIEGVAVTRIGDNAFNQRESLQSVVLPDTVESIGDNAFIRCYNLQNFQLSAGVKSIGSSAFRNDESLERMTWKGETFDPFRDGQGIEIGNMAFTDCFFVRLDFSPSYKRGIYYQNLHSNSTRKLLKGRNNYLSDVIVIAKSQLGYHEGDSYDQMDGSSYGFDDYSEYTCWWGEPGQMWCGEFVAWCIAMASVPEEVFRRKYQTPTQLEWKDTTYAGSGGSYVLKQGDVLHFDYDGGNHVCLVYGSKTEGDKLIITTLDGNHTNDVSWGSYTVNKSDGHVTNEWVGKNAHIETIYSPDASTAAMEKITFYRLSFNVNGGNPLEKDGDEGWFMEPDHKDISYGAMYGIMPIPTRDGYEFAGWYTKPEEGMDGDYRVTSYRVFKEHSDQTLFARWAKYDSGKDPESYSGSGKTYSDVREVVLDGLTWKIDAPTGTITEIPAAWTGGNIPSEIDGVEVKAIADKACYQNQNVTEVIIPEGVTELGVRAFFFCPKLEHVKIPASMRKIGEQCFIYCYELEDIEFAGNIDDIRVDRYSFYRTPWFHGDYSDEFKHGPWYQELLKLQNGIDTEDDPELTGDPLSDMIKIGVSQMGYHEGDTRAELTGLNPNGTGEYAEPVFFSGSPDYLWFKNVPQRSYGGWCGQYCSWVLRMAGLSDVVSGMFNSNNADNIEWDKLTIAGKGGTHELKQGDVLHMRIGHYCIVYSVEERDGWVYVKTLNGNHGNAVSWDTYRLDPSNGRQKKDGTKDNYDVTNILVFRPDALRYERQYSLNFNANGGNVGIDQKTVYHGAFYGLLPEPELEGRVFEGWYTEPDGGEKVTSYRKVRDSDSDVTVYAHWIADSTSVTGINMTKAEDEVKIGETIQLGASVVPATASKKDVTWRSAEESIATVDKNGVVTGVSKGEVNIVATTEDGGFCGRTLVTVTDGSKKYELPDGGGYVWFNEETGAITGAELEKDEITIPEKLGGVTVVEIGRNAFYAESFLSRITLPDTVKRIGISAFERSGLTVLTIPASVREIRGYAFSHLSSLSSLTIESGTKYIYSGAFCGCSQLENVYIPNTVKYIYSRAFDGCESLATATFQGSRDNLTRLDDSAFSDNTTLVFGDEDYEGIDPYEPAEDPDIPGSYEIGTRESDYKVDENGIIINTPYNIVNAQIPETVGGITVRGFKEYAFGTRTKLKALSIPSGVKEIGTYSFWTCPALETLFIPDNVESIGDYAFGIQKNTGDVNYTPRLTKVTIGKGIKTIGKYAFIRQTALEEVYIRVLEKDVTIDKTAFPDGVKIVFLKDPDEETETETEKESETETETETETEPSPEPTPTPDPFVDDTELLKDIDVDKADQKLTMIPGEVRRLELNKTGKLLYGVRWTLSPGTKCLSVKNGVVTAKKAGTSTVTAFYNGQTIPFEITVDDNDPAFSAGDKANKITAIKTVSAVVGTDKKVTVTLPRALYGKAVTPDKKDGDYGCFTLSGGVQDTKGAKVSFTVTPKKAGASWIVWSVTGDAGLTQAVTKVIVKEPAGDVRINGGKTELNLTVGQGTRLILTSTKGNTDTKAPAFSVKMTGGKGVKVSKSGFVTATVPDAIATVTVKLGKAKPASIRINVSDANKDRYLSLNKTSVTLSVPKKGEKTAVLKVAVPKKEKPGVTWSLEGTHIGISVGAEDGRVAVKTGASPGCYTVTATPVDPSGGYNSASCEVIVK